MTDIFSAASNIQKFQSELSRLDARHVRIIAVSKTHGPEKIREYLLAGQRDFAESRQNEARDKFPLVETSDLSIARQPVYHHIGPLQSGSARQIPGLFDYVHGVSGWKALDILLKSVEKYKASHDKHYLLKYLIQINLTEEDSKAGGMSANELLKQNSLPKANGAYPVGLMTLGPANMDPGQTRNVFRALKQLRDEKIPNGELSMGMTGDWKIAVEEGSTMLRIGSGLFGKRNPGPWKPST